MSRAAPIAIACAVVACSAPRTPPEPPPATRAVAVTPAPPDAAAEIPDAGPSLIPAAVTPPVVVVTATDECGLVLDAIYFAAGSAALQAHQLPALDGTGEMLACLVRTKALKRFEVGGHADDREPDPLRLSEQRAVVVANALVAKGVPASAMTAVGYGNTQPRDRRKTKRARAKNRRVEFLVRERGAD